MTSYMRTTHNLSLEHTIPSSLSREAVLSYLHNHERMLSAQPNVSSYVEQGQPSISIPSANEDDIAKSTSEVEDVTGDGFLDSTRMRTYEVKEDVPLIGAIYFKSSFQDEPDGVKSVVVAPMGLIMKAYWQAIESERVGGEAESGLMLKETCKISVNALFMPFVEWQFKKAHETMLTKIIDDLGQP